MAAAKLSDEAFSAILESPSGDFIKDCIAFAT